MKEQEDSEAQRQKRRLKKRKAKWIVRLSMPFIRCLYKSWRIKTCGFEKLDSDEVREKGVIFAFFHGQMLPLAFEFGRSNGHVMVSEHGDGELISQVLTRVGMKTLRGSTTRGGRRALLEMSRIPRKEILGITPDGPTGPSHSFAEGVLLLAQHSGRLIVPIAAVGSPAWRARSWDRFMVPKPFAKVCILIGTPFELPKRLSKNERATLAETVRQGMLQAEKDAWQVLGKEVPAVSELGESEVSPDR